MTAPSASPCRALSGVDRRPSRILRSSADGSRRAPRVRPDPLPERPGESRVFLVIFMSFSMVVLLGCVLKNYLVVCTKSLLSAARV
jgi:hypothetical protein